RKAELYEKATGVKPNKVIVITAFIHDKNPDLIIARAETLGVTILKPGEDISNN
ncbi:MAG: PD-(D/E)XK nuclease family protein, partial [Thermocladium sp.]